LLLLVLGLPGWYARVSAHTGRTGFVGWLLVVLGVINSDFVHCPAEFGPAAALRKLPIEQAADIWSTTYSVTSLAWSERSAHPAGRLGDQATARPPPASRPDGMRLSVVDHVAERRRRVGCRGFGGQLLYIVPARDTVAVVNAWNVFGTPARSIGGPLLEVLTAER
jgi:CubicO group peptidase (beta-lactamase class C family)